MNISNFLDGGKMKLLYEHDLMKERIAVRDALLMPEIVIFVTYT